jgi:plastocyanin
MSNETLFYMCGGILAASAVIVSLLGLKRKDFPGKALPLVILWFAIFVGGATTFAVLHAQDEEQAKAAEKAAESEEGGKEAQGGTTLHVEASATALEFDTTELEAEAGEVTIDFKNPSAIAHNVVIQQNGKQLAGFEPIAEGEESETANLKPGTYTFLCTVPGHAAAGMEGTLTVK